MRTKKIVVGKLRKIVSHHHHRTTHHLAKRNKVSHTLFLVSVDGLTFHSSLLKENTAKKLFSSISIQETRENITKRTESVKKRLVKDDKKILFLIFTLSLFYIFHSTHFRHIVCCCCCGSKFNFFETMETMEKMQINRTNVNERSNINFLCCQLEVKFFEQFLSIIIDSITHFFHLFGNL